MFQKFDVLLGYTPLSAAVIGRKWDTAKMVMAIAVAQYQPKDKTEKFSVQGILLGKCHILQC